MVFPESVDLGAAGKGQKPGTFTWYETGSVQYVSLGVHEIGKKVMSHLNQSVVFTSLTSLNFFI